MLVDQGFLVGILEQFGRPSHFPCAQSVPGTTLLRGAILGWCLACCGFCVEWCPLYMNGPLPGSTSGPMEIVLLPLHLERPVLWLLPPPCKPKGSEWSQLSLWTIVNLLPLYARPCSICLDFFHVCFVRSLIVLFFCFGCVPCSCSLGLLKQIFPLLYVKQQNCFFPAVLPTQGHPTFYSRTLPSSVEFICCRCATTTTVVYSSYVT